MPDHTLTDLPWDNRFVRELPADPDTRNVPRQVVGACFTRVAPTPVRAPRLVAVSPEVLAELGWAADVAETAEFAEVFGGNRVLPGMDPYAMCYGGHQFGHWAGQLGDGRAINLGEVVAADGIRRTLQLKGAGRTPYSRGADGLAVLRSSVREFLCSEAMHHLGVPTTRALSLVLTGEQVMRDMFYDGRAAPEPGAVVCRVAPSFVRFGSFEILAATGQRELLQQLADFAIREHFPELWPASGAATPATYADWFAEVCRRTGEMAVHWQRVGFVHGVMNTDNMSILGETIDYGPYGWLEDYDPNWTPNTTDANHRRYRFGQQGRVAHWNLAQLANALVPLVEETAPLQAALDDHGAAQDRRWDAMMASKLGLARHAGAADGALIDELLAVLALVETDMTIFFRRLGARPVGGVAGSSDPLAPLADAYYQGVPADTEVRARTAEWLAAYDARIREQRTTDAERRAAMDAVNPKYVLRNYLAQQAIDEGVDSGFPLLHELLDVLRRPYDEQPDKERLAAKRPEWARHKPGCSTLSCSS